MRLKIATEAKAEREAKTARRPQQKSTSIAEGKRRGKERRKWGGRRGGSEEVGRTATIRKRKGQMTRESKGLKGQVIKGETWETHAIENGSDS